MAKSPEVIEFCRIHAETTLDRMGHVIAALTRLGVTNIGHELVTEVARYKKRDVHDISSQDLTMAWLREHPTFKAVELLQYFEANGRSGSGCYHVLGDFAEKGIVKKLGGGNYTRADVKAIEKPKPHFAISGKQVILDFIRKRKSFAIAEIKGLFTEQSRNPASVSPIVDGFVRNGLCKRKGEAGSGEYLVLAKAKQVKKAAPKPIGANSHRSSKLNGVKSGQPSSAPEMTETDHG